MVLIYNLIALKMKSNVLLIAWAHLKIFLEGGGVKKIRFCFCAFFVISQEIAVQISSSLKRVSGIP